MPIIYHENSGQFHLTNGKISYIMHILRDGRLGQLYFGRALRDRESFFHLFELRPRPLSPCPYEGDLSYTLEHIKQEYPSYGSGDMRNPAFEILQQNGSRLTDFKVVSHRIYPGKPGLCGLPATYAEADSEATTLDVTLRDELINTELVLSYTIFENEPAIARSARFTNHGEDIVLTNAMSMSLDMQDSDFEMVELTGAWARERFVKTRRLTHGVQSIYSLRGASSANYNPFLALKRPNADEYSGEVYAFSLVYSGNFLAQAEVDTYDATRVTLGIHPTHFSWKLRAGESFQTPECVMVYSGEGLNGMSGTFHRLYRTRLARGVWRDKARPILINNWEATYFDFDEEKLLNLARTAKGLGIELFVLDDGWFRGRNDDTTSLGDWVADEKKLPNGIKGIAEKITALGMQFGLWFEPEMVNLKSELYRRHPEWMLKTPGRPVCHGRNQYVLDFSKKEVVDYLYSMMEKILRDAPVSYIKWDMNRNLSDVFSSGMDADYQGTVMHRYILGVYDLYQRLNDNFPEILFESCASGGGRFDPGLLYYAPQGWCSDNNDAIERIKIQYGTSFVYPISSIGAHVAAVPNHQVLRITPIETRANVACFGTFGYELDVNALPPEELEKIKEQVAFMKKYRELLQFGAFYRLRSPFEGNVAAWMAVSPDRRTALVGYYRVLQPVNAGYERIRLLGLDENLKYHVSINETDSFGDELMNYGLITSDAASGQNYEKFDGTNGDFQSRIYVLTAVESAL